MTELEFTLTDGRYVSQEVSVEGDYNVHLELEERGMVGVEQRTAGTKFCSGLMSGDAENVMSKVFDFDFTHLVYPKTVRVWSMKKVECGYLTEAE